MDQREPGVLMRRRYAWIGAVMALSLGLSAGVGAQQRRMESNTSLEAELRDSTWSIGMWGAMAANQPLRTRIGHTYNRNLYITALRTTRQLYSRRDWSIEYAGDFIPLVWATQNPEYPPGSRVVTCDEEECTQRLVPVFKDAYAFGIAPLGFQVRFGATRYFRIVAGGSGGGLYFNRTIPDPRAARFNFMASGNVGIQCRTPLGSVFVGGQLNHISNGNTGDVNPSMNSRMLSVGYAW